MTTRKRKLWSTSFPRIGGDRHRHESQAAVYRYVRNEAANWQCGALRSKHLTVWVDTREGKGWQRFEDIDLAEFGSEKP